MELTFDFDYDEETNRYNLLSTYDIDLDLMIASVRGYAAGDPERKATCLYVVDGRCECIIGKALGFLGVPVAVLEFVQSCDPDNPWVEDCTICALAGAPTIFVEDQRLLWLNEVQKTQDFCESWGDAVKEADAKYPLGK